ncbi:MAG: GNAT family N-acetyltransferase [Deltaproteobacteria bacterium]|nr:GNAT family N-acetyltransferase [Deltaproteobacteria bacterium]
MNLRVHHQIDELAPSQWDRLAGDNVMASHGWLRTVEATSVVPIQPRYVAVHERDDIVAAALCAIVPSTDMIETLDHMIFGKLKPFATKFGISLHPALVCGPLHSFGTHLIFDPDTTSRQRYKLTRVLLDSIESTAHSEGCVPAFLQVMSTEIELYAELRARVYLKGRHIPTNFLNIEWSTFDEYLGHLNTVSRDARKDIRRQINQNRKRGTEIRLLDDPLPHQNRLHRILENNSLRHNRRPFSFRPEFFSQLKRNLGDDALLYIAEKNGNITGVSVVLKRGYVVNLPLVGVDHELAGNDFTYFNLAQYRPIADAISDGVQIMNFGRELYGLKARRGCHVADLSLWVKPTSRVVACALSVWLRVLNSWIRLKLPERVRGALRQT